MASKITYILAILIATTLLAFQNCGKAEFTAVGEDDQNSGLGTPIICDPFSAQANCNNNNGGNGNVGGSVPGSGVLGNVYLLPNGQKVDDYIDKGTRLPILVQLSHLDIPQRSWTAGFPAPGGGVLKHNGQDLIEFFALDLTGFFQLPPNVPEGEYQFATHSDDGSIFYLDNKEIVNNDGTHPMQWKCASTKVVLKHADKHTLRLKYYQGPRVEIGLQVKMRKWANKNKPCDASGGWQIIPAAGLSH